MATLDKTFVGAIRNMAFRHNFVRRIMNASFSSLTQIYCSSVFLLRNIHKPPHFPIFSRQLI